jgi:hypothetical protein
LAAPFIAHALARRGRLLRRCELNGKSTIRNQLFNGIQANIIYNRADAEKDTPDLTPSKP